jgi:acyl-CoA reductase-like NAD-dependent aldehyde dehydrogenase
LGLDAKSSHRFTDADMEIAVNEAVAGSLSFNSNCTALKIIFVHEVLPKILQSL